MTRTLFCLVLASALGVAPAAAVAGTLVLPSARDCPGEFFVTEESGFNVEFFIRQELKRGPTEVPPGSMLGFDADAEDGKRMNDQRLAVLSRVPQLSFVRITHGEDITAAGLSALAANRSLRYLEIEVLAPAAQGLGVLARLPSLRYLKLALPAQAGDQSLATVANFKALQAFEVAGNGITGTGFKAWSRHTQLREISVVSEALSDEGVRALASIPGVQKLRIFRAPRVTAAGVTALGKCQGLRVLDLRRVSQLTDAAVRSLIALPSLEELNLEAAPISDQGVALLRQLPRLRQLSLSSCSTVSDQAVAQIAQMQGLRDLSLYETPITDRSLEHIGRMKQLEKLNVDMCPKLTKGAKAKLKKSLPQLKQSLGLGS